MFIKLFSLANSKRGLSVLRSDQGTWKEKHPEHLNRIQTLCFVQNKEEKGRKDIWGRCHMPLRTNWEHFITNTSYGRGLLCLSSGKKKKKKADEWEENRKKKGERWYVTDLVTSPPIAFSFSKVSYLFWNPNFHQFDGMKLLISH